MTHASSSTLLIYFFSYFAKVAKQPEPFTAHRRFIVENDDKPKVILKIPFSVQPFSYRGPTR